MKIPTDDGFSIRCNTPSNTGSANRLTGVRSTIACKALTTTTSYTDVRVITDLSGTAFATAKLMHGFFRIACTVRSAGKLNTPPSG